MSLHITAFTRYGRKGASSRVRFLQYVPHLQTLGADVSVHPLLPPEYLDRLYSNGSRSAISVGRAMAARITQILRTKKSDIIWLQRELLPFAPFFIENAFLSKRKLVVDFDDAHHLYYKEMSSSLAKRIWGNKIENLMLRADAVVAGNQVLADFARSSGAGNVHIVPSAVDVNRFPCPNPSPDTFTVGWIGTPVTAQQSLPLLRGTLLKFLSQHQAQCILIGVEPSQLSDIPAERIPWSEGVEELYLPRLSVGLCPLEDTSWNRGKSGYKIIQYMAAGKPSLVSPVGIAESMIVHGQTGFHCRTGEDWLSSLSRLYADPDLCRRLGAAARAEAASKYDTAIAAQALFNIFESCRNA